MHCFMNWTDPVHFCHPVLILCGMLNDSEYETALTDTSDVMVIQRLKIHSVCQCLQCFDAVGWEAGRAFSP